MSNGVFTAEQVGAIEFVPLSRAPCEARAEPSGASMPLELTWGEQVKACQVAAPPAACGEPPPRSDAMAAPPPGFSRCALREGAHSECPPGYSSRSVFHGGVDSDAVGCTPCRCAAPEGGACRAFITAYEDGECSELRVGSAKDTETGGCQVSPDEGFGAMTAEWQKNEPGTCAPSGGEPFGEAVPVDPVTICCEAGGD